MTLLTTVAAVLTVWLFLGFVVGSLIGRAIHLHDGGDR